MVYLTDIEGHVRSFKSIEGHIQNLGFSQGIHSMMKSSSQICSKNRTLIKIRKMIITMRFLLMRSNYQHWKRHWWIIIFKQNFTVVNSSVTVQWLLNERMVKFRLRAPCQKITLEYEIYCMAIMQLFRTYWSTLPHPNTEKNIYLFFW